MTKTDSHLLPRLFLALAATLASVPPPALASPGPSASPAIVSASVEDMIEEAERGVVVVLALDPTGKQVLSTGSGFFVALGDQTLIATNLHVIDEAERLAIKFGEKHYPVRSVDATDDANDLALLRVDLPADAGHRPLPLNTTTPRRGSTVYVLGAPHGLEGSVSRGIVSSVRPFPGMTQDWVIQVDAPINPGNSGGPAVNERGEVVGVASFIRENAEGVNFLQRAGHVASLRPGVAVPISGWQDSRVDSLFNAARKQAKANSWKSAIAFFEKVVARRPGHKRAWFEFALALSKVDRDVAAITAFRRHLDTNPDADSAAKTWFNIGVLHAYLKDDDRSEAAFRQALEFDDAHAPALERLATLLEARGKWEEAARTLVRLIEARSPERGLVRRLSAALTNLGVSELHAGRTHAAAKHFENACEFDQENDEALFNLGLTSTMLNDQSSAHAVHGMLRSRNPGLAAKLQPFLR